MEHLADALMLRQVQLFCQITLHCFAAAPCIGTPTASVDWLPSNEGRELFFGGFFLHRAKLGVKKAVGMKLEGRDVSTKNFSVTSYILFTNNNHVRLLLIMTAAPPRR